MSRLYKLLLILILVSFAVPLVTGAVKINNPLKYKSFGELANAIINFIFTVSIPLAVIMLVVAGIFFITARGEPAKITVGKQMIIWTLVGLVIVVSAKGLVEFIRAFFEK